MIKIENTSTHVNIFFLIGKKKKKISIRKPYVKRFYEYLKNYKYVLENVQNVESSDKYNDVIWILWFQGEKNAPELVKKCIESVRYFHSDKQVIVLDLESLKNYIEIPNYIQEKYDKGIIPHANFSDYVRLCLLAKYGGTWIDSTVLLTDSIPAEIIDSECFFFKSTSWFKELDDNVISGVSPKEKKKIIKSQKKDKRTISSWFIHTRPNNRIILASMYFFQEYWKQETLLKDYFMLHKFISFLIENDEQTKEIFNKMYSVSNLYPHYIQREMKNEYDDESFKKALLYSCIHKLTYKNLEQNNQAWLNKINNLSFDDLKNTFNGY